MHGPCVRLLVLFSGLVGCNSGNPWTVGVGRLWSDDDESVAAVYEYYEGKNTVTHIEKL